MKTAKPRFKVKVGTLTGCPIPCNAWCFCVIDRHTMNKYYSGDVVQGVKDHANDLAAKGFKNLADRILAQLA